MVNNNTMDSKKRSLLLLLAFFLATATLSPVDALQKVKPTPSEDALSCENDEHNNNSSSNNNLDDGRDPPRILANGSFQDLEDLIPFRNVTSLSHDTLLDGAHRSLSPENSNSIPTKVAAIPGGEPIDLRYVRDLVSPMTAAALIEACDKRSGWTASPQSVGGAASVKATRTSRSCPLIWPQLYLPLLEDPAYKPRIEASGLKDEIDLTWRLTQRVAQLLNVGEEFIEPFQLVRYQPGEFYKEHHDHGSFYGATTEQRPMTLLVFLSDLPSNGEDANSGGYTKFRALGDSDSGGVSVVPRMGDGVWWNNEDEDGNLLMDAIHEAIPPEDQEGIIKYAMNVWVAKKKIQDNMDVSAYRTQ